ncbi:hypothetical protein AQUCO_00500641v1 [Aquilegia coerulea]|uniref:Late embryogenesis abundant protein At5g17165-like n=1 Tax=Aquilegia coerulea TaxID=218851 RepID=A0A2G5ESY2_AQUCA|nr:hypothetical protein AQUCO_00500641v1 [Aquilegia coerulea]
MAAAANSKISSVGKRFLTTQISRAARAPADSTPGATVTAFIRRGVHTSVYDKNIDEQVRPTVVPDDVIESPSDKYWSPHPHTGVFGPTAQHTEGGERRTLPSNDGSNTVLEQQAWFRPLENVEKPHEEMDKPAV